MNIPYLLKALGTSKLSELVAHMDEAPLDVNIALWDAVKNGSIEMDEKKDKVKLLVDVSVPVNDTEEQRVLRRKIVRVVQHYTEQELAVTRGRLFAYMKDPATQMGYKTHDFVMAMQYLLDTKQIVDHTISVPEIKNKRPFNKFVFYFFPDTDQREEWAAKAVNQWIKQFEEKKKKK